MTRNAYYSDFAFHVLGSVIGTCTYRNTRIIDCERNKQIYFNQHNKRTEFLNVFRICRQKVLSGLKVYENTDIDSAAAANTAQVLQKFLVVIHNRFIATMCVYTCSAIYYPMKADDNRSAALGRRRYV